MRFVAHRIAVVIGMVFAFPGVVSAHAFGQQYTLPLPLSFYILGGVSAFIASCAIILLFSDPQSADSEVRVLAVFKLPHALTLILKWGGIAAAFLFLAISILGSQNWYENPVIDFFWVGLLLCFTYLNVIVDGLWDRVNPFRTIASRIFDSDSAAILRYPSWLGCIPAIFFFFVLISLELFSNGLGTFPLLLGVLFILYSILMNIGSGLFRMEDWFCKGDFFTAFFALIGKFAPVRLSETTIEIRAPKEWLVRESAPSLSLIFFVLFILAATALDGLKDTNAWNLATAYYLPHWGVHLDVNVVGMFALCIVPGLFFCLYLFAIWLGKIFTRTELTLRTLLLRFGYSLVPIAIAYHFAHYFDFLLGEVQRVIPLLSDPLTQGWNLFGTKDYAVNLIPIGADTVWYTQFSAIVIGHIIAAVVAHRIAVRTFISKRDIILGQLPMLVLMVFYTALGLWILAQR